MVITFTLIQIFSRNRKEVDTDPFHFLDLVRVWPYILKLQYKSMHLKIITNQLLFFSS